MRNTVLSALGLVAVLAAPAVAVGTPGPFAGVARQGTTTAHAYDNNPSGGPCPQVMVGYTVRLTWAPPTDTLTLSAFGVSTTRSGGVTTLNTVRSYCTSFSLAVTGTSVANAAAYTLTVTRDTAGGGTLARPTRY